MKEVIKKTLEKIIPGLQEVNLKQDEVSKLVEIARNKEENFGDYSSNIAMVLASRLKKNPMQVAEEIVELLNSKISEEIEKVEVAKPGYINFYLSEKYFQSLIKKIDQAKENFGKNDLGKGKKVNNEFISANPTGPLHLGNGRGGFLGDALSNVLEKNGYEVTREYYVNNAGEQVVKLGHSVLKDSEAVYKGDYIDELSEKFSNGEDIYKVGEKATENILENIIKPTVAEKMKINFDFWISEKKDLIENNLVEKAINILKDKKLTYEKDGALWLKTTNFNDDQDRVLIKKDGNKTYFASDCGYLLLKIEKNYDKIIEIWGADHHGYVKRFEAASQALGFQGELNFILVQLVKLVKNGKEVKMSKRQGNVVYIDELIDEFGHDVVRFIFLLYSSNTHMNFDLEVAKEKSEKNPVFYVQYAHARISSILEKGKNLKVGQDLALLKEEKEKDLMRELDKFSGIIEEIGKTFEVHRLAHYTISLADKFHSFYNSCRVIDEENLELTGARLKLVEAVKIVLGESLELLGVEALEKM